MDSSGESNGGEAIAMNDNAKVLLLGVFILVAVLSIPWLAEDPSPSASDMGDEDVHVKEVIDGDTIEVRRESGAVTTVRLAGIDTPEITSGGSGCRYEYGVDAAYFVLEASQSDVDLHVKEEGDQRGYYGRLLAYVIVDGENLNYLLVERGYAEVYEDFQFAQRERFEEAEEEARRENRGIWGC